MKQENKGAKKKGKGSWSNRDERQEMPDTPHNTSQYLTNNYFGECFEEMRTKSTNYYTKYLESERDIELFGETINFDFKGFSNSSLKGYFEGEDNFNNLSDNETNKKHSSNYHLSVKVNQNYIRELKVNETEGTFTLPLTAKVNFFTRSLAGNHAAILGMHGAQEKKRNMILLTFFNKENELNREEFNVYENLKDNVPFSTDSIYKDSLEFMFDQLREDDKVFSVLLGEYCEFNFTNRGSKPSKDVIDYLHLRKELSAIDEERIDRALNTISQNIKLDNEESFFNFVLLTNESQSKILTLHNKIEKLFFAHMTSEETNYKGNISSNSAKSANLSICTLSFEKSLSSRLTLEKNESFYSSVTAISIPL